MIFRRILRRWSISKLCITPWLSGCSLNCLLRGKKTKFTFFRLLTRFVRVGGVVVGEKKWLSPPIVYYILSFIRYSEIIQWEGRNHRKIRSAEIFIIIEIRNEKALSTVFIVLWMSLFVGIYRRTRSYLSVYVPTNKKLNVGIYQQTRSYLSVYIGLTINKKLQKCNEYYLMKSCTYRNIRFCWAIAWQCLHCHSYFLSAAFYYFELHLQFTGRYLIMKEKQSVFVVRKTFDTYDDILSTLMIFALSNMSLCMKFFWHSL